MVLLVFNSESRKALLRITSNDFNLSTFHHAELMSNSTIPDEMSTRPTDHIPAQGQKLQFHITSRRCAQIHRLSGTFNTKLKT